MTDLIERAGERIACASCGSKRWTRTELNLHHGQAGRCYPCFDQVRARIAALKRGVV